MANRPPDGACTRRRGGVRTTAKIGVRLIVPLGSLRLTRPFEPEVDVHWAAPNRRSLA
jgi:hypothetical protein